MQGREIREAFLAFFEERGHSRVASAPLIPRDPTLLFVNAGMVPFKRVFTGEESRPYKRATSSQKVMRVSGKHNDLEEVGRSPRHHTFFEMLGNFSFGDYGKEQAIVFAWELITQHYKLNPDQLVVSVFREDDESAQIWQREIGLSEQRIYRLDEAENFWTMGDTGPCGPCTEIHLDRGPVKGFPDDNPASDSGRFLEFWNLVFMQFNRDAKGKRTKLPKLSVDTGMGLERMTQILQGKANNFETDLFAPVLQRACELTGAQLGADAEADVSLRVIADHARACAFLIGDGVLPANEGRGYVARRILRRAARHGAKLGCAKPFLFDVVEAVIAEMGAAFPELQERRAYICERTRVEEARFGETLAKGLALLEDEIAELKARGQNTLPGPAAFRLYDTYGFPADLTADILREHGLQSDTAGFEKEMAAQRSRSREAWAGSGDAQHSAGAAAEQIALLSAELQCEFTGYAALHGEAEIHTLLREGAPVQSAGRGAAVEIITAQTPFYAESGGQVGDSGAISTPTGRAQITDTQNPAGKLIVHRGRVVEGEVQSGQRAQLQVDADARAATVRNHSGTHLLHAALRETVGSGAMQKGSLVAPDKLRFDFTHDAPLGAENISAIEDKVNGWIAQNAPAAVREMPYADAIAAGAVAMFEEKYGDRVRVVQFGDASTELCGGTHAQSAGEIGMLKIISESAVAAGIRRVEALTGPAALQHLRARENTLRETAELLRVAPAEVPRRISKLLEERKQQLRQITALKKQAAAGGSAAAAGGDSTGLETREVAGVKTVVRRIPAAAGVGAKELREVVDALRARCGNGVVLAVAENAADGAKVSLALGVSKDLTQRFPAGALVRELAAAAGGKGGGGAHFAQGAGAAAQVPQAIARFYALLEEGAQN